MAGLVLDGAGQVKMDTLNVAIALHQRIHSSVEQYALSVKNKKPEPAALNSVKRNLPVMAAKLKNQFGMISDLATAVYMGASRGAGDVQRVRGLREGVAALKAQLDIAVTQTIAKHEKHDDKPVVNRD